MVQMIATDMDGTLLNHEGKISPENQKALRLAREKGILVVIATGRSYQGAVTVLEEAGLRLPLIHLNGACIRSEKGMILREISLDVNQVRKLHEAFRAAGIYHELYTSGGIYCNRDGFQNLKGELDRLQIDRSKVQDWIRDLAKKQFRTTEICDRYYEDVMEEAKSPVFKVLAFSLMEEKLAEAREKAKSVAGVCVTSSNGQNIEINHPEAQKGIAVEFFARLHGIPMERVMVLGDQFNDLSMMKRAGVSVAMGNADEEVKKACRYVTRTNDEHGVAYAIQTWAGIEAVV
ncbi:Cof-type HAD-IIB family hydrolase [Thermoactinomyces vulgaris]|jgi:Cof subfamily protein (haloacid dehalogenase superfamily)|uniref:Cof-type HAD-IIB family hydrolase n=1 Tax=Thermoactinomyces vulgaris TaxID=2026 RepID=UPI001586F1C9|nr:Cof-type HAD-IIB family hydrolase [Thermoactinomyces vulgaris]